VKLRAFKNFKSAKLPLKVGIRADILVAMPDVEPKLIEAALREYCYHRDYQRYLTEGAGRVNAEHNEVEIGPNSRSTSSGLSLAQVFLIPKSVLRPHAQTLRLAR
jgi:hypothetical protein